MHGLLTWATVLLAGVKLAVNNTKQNKKKRCLDLVTGGFTAVLLDN